MAKRQPFEKAPFIKAAFCVAFFRLSVSVRTVGSIGMSVFQTNNLTTVTFPAGYVLYVICTICMYVAVLRVILE